MWLWLQERQPNNERKLQGILRKQRLEMCRLSIKRRELGELLNQPLATAQFRNIAPGAGRTLGDYVRPIYNQGLSNIRPSPVAANNFELKQGLLQTLQNCCVFRGKMNEDPKNHLMNFEEIMNTFQYNGVSQDAIYLRAFPFTLKDDAKQLLRSLPTGSIRIWDEMTRKFLDKYFSSAKTGKFRREIHNFCQKDTETVFEAWERFKQIDGLTPTSPRTLSNVVGGPLIKKTPDEIATILDEMSKDANQWPSDCAERRRSTGAHQLDANKSLQKHPSFSWSSPGGTANAWQQNNPIFKGQRAPGFVNQPRPLFQHQQSNQPDVILEKESGEQLKIKVDKKKKGKNGANKKKREESSRREEHEESKCMPALPFPQKLYREKLDKQFERFLDMLKQVNVNLSFSEVLSQMPAYAKFLKKIMIKKRNIKETSVVKLTEHCSIILQNKLLQKCGDPESFTIPYSLGTINFEKSLCDSGASINLMPLSIYRKLENEIGEIKSAPISL
uniref:Uncharacterized protein LOC104246678 n=1 Tax=Nicotiana sylvestris TaxID=4096 RepID=A0A1U7YFW6_NICSY|nr:PREDICTED: uncharacterized protein LOC104246678 [Nicotiana sylvestris]